MSAIRSGSVTAYYLFDVAERIDLAAIPALVQGQTAVARLTPKPATPAYIQYREPPLLIEGADLQSATLGVFRLRVKVFGYGVLSLAFSREFSGSWEELVAVGHDLIADDRLERDASASLARITDRLAPALHGRRADSLGEDYFVFAVTGIEPLQNADDLIAAHGSDVAHLLRGERSGLSRQEREEVLRHRLSYLEEDLVIPSWNAAFVRDTSAGVPAALEIFEYANSQLLEFRYYDALLDTELERIYADLQKPRWYDVFGRRRVRATTQLHSLFIDVNELTDKMENALKLVGDIYAARLYSLAAARLGLDRWKATIVDKLDTLDDIYRFSVEQIQVTRGHILELIVVLILVIELGFIFAGLMK